MSGALAIQKSVMETYFTRMPWDLVLAQIQPFYNVYALKTPLVFQDGMYESSTKFTFDDITRHPYNKNNIHLTSLSVKVSKNNFSV
jgi:hypothetical protein